MRQIDLHTHSTASDGTDTPTELVHKAKAAGLKALALTDHDTTAGLAEAGEAARALGLELIRGCEISVATDCGNMHMLGLFLPEDSSSLDNFLEQLRKNRDSRNQKIIEKLQQHGVPIELEEVQALAGPTIGRPHFAQILVQKGVCQSRNEAFSDWLGIGGKAFVPKGAPSPEDALAILHKLGATTCLAHPMHKPKDETWLESFISRLRASGLNCLEAWHSNHDSEHTRKILELAQKYGLGLSGGSDYHGKNKPDIELGSGKNNIDLNYDILATLKQARLSLSLPC